MASSHDADQCRTCHLPSSNLGFNIFNTCIMSNVPNIHEPIWQKPNRKAEQRLDRLNPSVRYVFRKVPANRKYVDAFLRQWIVEHFNDSKN